jgi:hypothetical protein
MLLHTSYVFIPSNKTEYSYVTEKCNLYVRGKLTKKIYKYTAAFTAALTRIEICFRSSNTSNPNTSSHTVGLVSSTSIKEYNIYLNNIVCHFLLTCLQYKVKFPEQCTNRCSNNCVLYKVHAGINPSAKARSEADQWFSKVLPHKDATKFVVMTE